ncbi:MAG: hypothetical protein J5863_04475, partial [Desulfovibrio sp.]|nr:hypothetical protein [Desulfovibrio sp.]
TFMEGQGIRLDADVEYACGFFSEEDELVACGGHAGAILKGFAVAEEARGCNMLGRLVSAVTAHQAQQGRTRLRVFTAPDKVQLFESSGFGLVACGTEAALLENFKGGVERFAGEARQRVLVQVPGADFSSAGAVVMNCNPFTRGHRSLVERAAGQSSLLYVFVVEEDRSVFPFDVRIRLVREGLADLANVAVLPSGPYMISQATFPSYFIKEQARAGEVCTDLDAVLFARRIAPALGIRRRFAGTEPSCAVTGAYNRIMASVLPAHGIEFVEFPRLEADGAPVSASAVRQLLAAAGPSAPGLDRLLSPCVLRWLSSTEAAGTLARLADKA